MCRGVRRAIRIAEAVVDPSEGTIRGELVHNEHILDELAGRGFHMEPESCGRRIPATAVVLIPAHGTSRGEMERLRAAGKSVIDATCPLVQRIHLAARGMERRGCLVIVIGKRGHAEVVGLAGDLDRCEIVETLDDVTCYPAERLGVLCQSTVSPEMCSRILDEIRSRNSDKDIEHIPSICKATRDRQAAALALLDRVDAMVVVGGRHSNNTVQLARLALSHGVPCIHIQTADDINPEWFVSFETVGLTAGTSTPDEVIERVRERLLGLDGKRGLSATSNPLLLKHTG